MFVAFSLATNKRNETALSLACQNGKEDAIEVLLNAGADKNIANKYGNTCLHEAVTQSFSNAVLQAIIDHGAELNVKNMFYQTALALACGQKKEDAIHVLLNAGADPNIAYKTGNTCLHEAVIQTFSETILEAIIDHGAEVNTRNKQYETALQLACEKGNTDLINILLNAGADPNIADTDGNTCLHNAVCSGVQKGFQAIIDHGVDVNATNKIKQHCYLHVHNKTQIS